MKVQAQNIKKVEETHKLLLKVIKKPSNYSKDENLFLALTSQGALAKYSDPEKEITSCALNTLKTNAEFLLKEGFKTLDTLRKNAKIAIEKDRGNVSKGTQSKQSLKGLQAAKIELEEEIEAMRFACFNLTTIIGELRGHSKKLAESSDSVEMRRAQYESKSREIELKLSHAQQSDDLKQFLIDYKRFLDASS